MIVVGADVQDRDGRGVRLSVWFWCRGCRRWCLGEQPGNDLSEVIFWQRGGPVQDLSLEFWPVSPEAIQLLEECPSSKRVSSRRVPTTVLAAGEELLGMQGPRTP